MKPSLAGIFLGSAIIGVMALAPVASAKTAKECRTEWTANKAANKAKGITEKAYVSECRAGASAEKSKTKEKASTAAEKKSTAAEKKSERKEKASGKMGAPAAGEKKTAKECESEWRANKAANQAKRITEKAYVAECRSGTAAMKPAAAPVETKMAPPSTAPKETKMAPPMAPAKSNAKSNAKTETPGMGKPEGGNQFAAETAAKAHCPGGLVVWANLDSKIYHFSGHADYGHTKEGAYMCEKDAMSQGLRAAKNEKHP
ncbi:MAG: hypothetical protein ACREB8_05715 [Pseudolabrys sp.]